MTTPLRIGVIPFLNVRPRVRSGEDPDLGASPPLRLARRLGQGEVDVAIAPLAAHLQRPQWPIVPVAAVASKGPVLMRPSAPQGPL
jgi:predicted solute-binding protein